MTDEIPTRPGPAFSNATEWDTWEANWCERCARDAAFRAGTSSLGCELVLIAMCGDATPAAWWETEPGSPDRYRCVEYRSTEDGDGGPEPTPEPEPPDMDGLFPRPERRVRMLAGSIPELTPAVRTLQPAGRYL